MRKAFFWITIGLVMFAAGCGSKKVELSHAQLKIIQVNHEAANAGDAHAMFNIARAYDNRQGITKSNFQAVNWYKKAADAGSFEAMAWLSEQCDIQWVTPQALIIMLENRGPAKKIKAIKAMGQMADSQFALPLIKLLDQSENSDVLNEAAKALKKVTGKNFGKNPEKWADWLKQQEIQ